MYGYDDDVPEDTPSLENPHYDLLKSENFVSAREANWLAWVKKVEKLLGHDLDGDEEADGYSLDYAYAAWECDLGPGKAGVTPEEYVAEVNDKKAKIAAAKAAA